MAVRKRRQAYLLNEVLRAFFRVEAGKLAARGQRKNDVLFHGFPWQELIEFLEYKNAVRSGRADHGSVQKNSSLRRLQVSSRSLQDRGFSASGRSENN